MMIRKAIVIQECYCLLIQIKSEIIKFQGKPLSKLTKTGVKIMKNTGTFITLRISESFDRK